MPNALTHRTVAAALTGIVILNKEAEAGKDTLARPWRLATCCYLHKST
jgi:hypothetical protein